ncbi:hypothetical protein FDP41_003027 [Naegleria fowleri]|uniref:Uncharacterized protein n=1 Tax=Naegleria fowleri TaxID=5763 RepID=A0A6A5BWL9_NAEFO|nr:uncharacterized protein FDP41_003027 [Naegleria fowleri]KAF0977705.1 hypothetical protein FDP41_003027 [Naegleria fowleri]
MLSYAQYNRNTMKVSSEIFSDLVKSISWIYTYSYYLKCFLEFLIRKLNDRLNLRKDSQFIIAIDDACLFLQFQTPILSQKGPILRNLFSVIEKEIFFLKGCSPNICDIYCGSYFKIESVVFIKSTLGRLREMTPPYHFIGLDLINFEQALQLLQTMYDVDALLEASDISKKEFYQSVKHMFPTRRRVFGLVASFLETTSSPNLVQIFKDQGKTITCDEKLASSVMSSGIAKPNMELFQFNIYTYCHDYQFDASDPILQKVAREIVTKKYLNSMSLTNDPISILNQILAIQHENPRVWNKIFPLLLQHHSGKLLKNNADCKSHNRRYEKELLVDVLYVHCLLNYNKPIEENWSTTFKDIIDGLYFYPSSLFCHADGICLNFSDDGPYGVIVSNKLHNCDTISEFFTDVQKGIKCTMSKKEDFNAILSSKNRLIPLVAHLHVKYQHIKTTKGERFIKGYSNGGKYLIMDPDPNSIRELCPDTFHLLQRNLFNTTKIK